MGYTAYRSEHPAFPGDTAWMWSGITMRDYFAAKALPKCIDFATSVHTEGVTTNYHTRADSAARLAYRIADEMLAARAEAQE